LRMRTAFQIYGQPQAPAEFVPLRAGPLRLLYDPANGGLRRIKLVEREVLRGIYAAVRDRNWDTVPGRIAQTSSIVGDDSFCIEFTSEHRQAEIDFIWHGRIEGTADGEVRYDFVGRARSQFHRNRIGFCVLHPIAECAGARARQTRLDGRTIECRFPGLIEPQIFGESSFQQLQGVAHEISPGVWAGVSFMGDVFEMEDQRNWTDASFKTYCTPLALPFPVEITSGQCIQQSVKLQIIGNIEPVRSTVSAIAHAANKELIDIQVEPSGRLPQIGLGVASHGESLTGEAIAALQRLQLSHLRADIHLSSADHCSKLEQALIEAEATKTRLELALHLPRNSEPAGEKVLLLLEEHKERLERILALREGEAATSPETIASVRAQFSRFGVPIGAGSDRNFCELNREQALGRLGQSEADFLFWSVNPQVHAFDHLSVMETLEAQSATVLSARAFANGKELVVSPITLKQRFNPVATSSSEPAVPGGLPPQVDTRQLSDFAAAWTLGSIATLAASNVRSATYYETTGWRGVMERDSGSLLPELFPSQPKERFPVYSVFEALAGCTHYALADSGDRTRIIAISLFSGRQLQHVLLANLTDSTQRLRVRASNAAAHSLMLEAYSVVRLEPDWFEKAWLKRSDHD